jgi:general stress protein 26
MVEQHHTHQKVHQFLKHHPMGVLATADIHGSPWGAAIYFFADENFNIFFVTRADTRKYKNIEENARVVLTVVDEPTQTSVQIAGTVTKVPPQDYMDVVFHKLEKIRPSHDASWTSPPTKIHKGNFMPLRILPTTLLYADYSKFKMDRDAVYVETIIG